MSIRPYVEELESIKTEVSANLKKNKALRIRQKQLEKYISDFLGAKQQPGVRMQSKAIVLKETISRPRKPKSEIQRSQMEVLASHHIQNPEVLLQQLSEAGKGAPVTKQMVKFHQLPRGQ